MPDRHSRCGGNSLPAPLSVAVYAIALRQVAASLAMRVISGQ